MALRQICAASRMQIIKKKPSNVEDILSQVLLKILVIVSQCVVIVAAYVLIQICWVHS